MTESVALRRAFVAVGSNIEPEVHVIAALDALLERVSVVAVSTFYQTRPVGVEGQDDYRNGVWAIDTELTPRALKFDVLRPIEALQGRVRTGERYCPRTLDLDIALFGECVVDEEDLQIPDPEIRSRPFVAAPLLELAPDLQLPDTHTPLREIEAAHRMEGLIPDEPLTRALRMRIHA